MSHQCKIHFESLLLFLVNSQESQMFCFLLAGASVEPVRLPLDSHRVVTKLKTLKRKIIFIYGWRLQLKWPLLSPKMHWQFNTEPFVSCVHVSKTRIGIWFPYVCLRGYGIEILWDSKLRNIAKLKSGGHLMSSMEAVTPDAINLGKYVLRFPCVCASLCDSVLWQHLNTFI